MWKVVLLLCTLLLAARSSSHTYQYQAGLYEWSAGDGNYVRANAKGTTVAVGFHTEFGSEKERRLLIRNVTAPETLRHAVSAGISFTVKQVLTPGNISLCRMLETWGPGAADASADPLSGVPAEQNDATWRFPHYQVGGGSRYWRNSMFGGYYADDDCLVAEVLRESKELYFTGSQLLERYDSWILNEHGLILVPASGVLVLLNGTTSTSPPTLLYVLEQSPEDFYLILVYAAIGIAVLIVAGVAVTIIVCLRRRSGYARLYDVEDYIASKDIQMTRSYAHYAEIISNSNVKVIDIADLHYSEESKIGEGSTGIVYAGMWNRQKVAIKKISTKITQDKAAVLNSLLREIVVMSAISHPNILETLGIVLGDGTSESIMMVTPLMVSRSLAARLHDRDTRYNPLMYDQKLDILYQVAEGIAYIHGLEQPVIHRDLKTDNVLLRMKDGYFEAVICDFGLCRLSSTENMTVAGTAPYMAPETVRGIFSTKTDVYAYGVLFVETINEQRPSASSTSFLTISSDDETDTYLPAGELFNNDDANLHHQTIIYRCRAVSPEKRPHMDDIIEHFNIYFETQHGEGL